MADPGARLGYRRNVDRSLSVTHRRGDRLVPIAVWPDVGTAAATGPADEARFDVGQPHLVGPAIGAEGDAMTAAVVGAID